MLQRTRPIGLFNLNFGCAGPFLRAPAELNQNSRTAASCGWFANGPALAKLRSDVIDLKQTRTANTAIVTVGFDRHGWIGCASFPGTRRDGQL